MTDKLVGYVGGTNTIRDNIGIKESLSGIENYDHKSSGMPDNAAAGNSLCSRRFLARDVSSRQLQIFEQ
ncbi:hypothetical protein TNCV_2807101 [Trichonephila clavipes]|nr:hypothetical protein TNCV_2807101 [Trichonephila clavipes]